MWTVPAEAPQVPRCPYDGLVAEAYEILVPYDLHMPDDGFHLSWLASRGGAACELGAGTGRLVWRACEAGLDVCGVEESSDMVRRGRMYARSRGLDPERLHEADMAELSGIGSLRSVFCTDGTFMLQAAPDRVRATLAAVHDALEPGGALALTLAGTRENADGVWRWTKSVRSDDAVYAVQECRVLEADGVEHIQKRIDKFSTHGVLVDSSLRYSRMRWWTRDAIAAALHRAGFVDVSHDAPEDDPNVWVTIGVRH